MCCPMIPFLSGEILGEVTSPLSPSVLISEMGLTAPSTLPGGHGDIQELHIAPSMLHAPACHVPCLILSCKDGKSAPLEAVWAGGTRSTGSCLPRPLTAAYLAPCSFKCFLSVF